MVVQRLVRVLHWIESLYDEEKRWQLGYCCCIAEEVTVELVHDFVSMYCFGRVRVIVETGNILHLAGDSNL